MNLFDISTIALIAAALGFYLQLFAAYRRKMQAYEVEVSRNANRKKARKTIVPKPTFGTFSKSKRDWFVGAVGYLMIMFGVLVYVNWIKIPGIQTSWWAPTTVGIILFSWFFH